MAQRRHFETLADLPASLPVFPLTGAIVLPRARLPLNIFEPRYLQMVDAAMTANRLIGMVQPQHPANDQRPPLYPVGCAGRITSYSETDDGRYLITLTGVSRFRIAAEMPATTMFRQVRADWGGFAGDLAAAPDDAEIGRDRLIRALRTYLKVRKLDADWRSVERAPAEILVNSLAMICPFEAAEKQALIEADTLRERAGTLVALMEMAAAAGGDGDDDGGPALQ